MSEEQGGTHSGGEVTVYEAPDGEARVEVVLEQETVWLTQAQMAELVNTSSDNVGLHIQNLYPEGELERGATTEEYSVVRPEGRRSVRRRLQHYNLDVIISVGYRVKSQRGTQFRIWATKTLRDRFIPGYTLNEKRLRQRGVEIEDAISLLSTTLQNQRLVTDEGQEVLDVVRRYTKSWRGRTSARLSGEGARRPSLGLSSGPLQS